MLEHKEFHARRNSFSKIYEPEGSRVTAQPRTIETAVCIIGGGATGTALMRDLALRGVASVLVERRDVNAGASGGNHGLLHSGARYVSTDPAAAAECLAENALLKRLAPQCIEDTGGLFAAVAGDDERFVADFPGLCAAAGIPALPVDPAEARELEPVLAPDVIAAYAVPDASIDPFRFSLENAAQAQALAGSRLLRRTRVTGFELSAGRVIRVTCLDETDGAQVVIEAAQVVNAAGAWAARIASLAGARVPMLYAGGTLLVTFERLADRVLNRLRPPADGDILVPGGTVSILGTTSVALDDPDDCRPTVREASVNVREGSRLAPILAGTRYIRAYSGVRPLVLSRPEAGDGRAASRGFLLADHEAEGLSNFCTITGGKLTTCRLMAEKTADLVAARLGLAAPCRTAEEPLPEAAGCQWTEPGRGPRIWAAAHDSGDPILCECELISASAVDEVLATCPGLPEDDELTNLGLRTRVGKGSCQGAFCGLRLAAYLHDTGRLDAQTGLAALRNFFAERFRGQRPVLHGVQLAQAELAEALHCGLIGLELPSTPAEPGDPA
jgi:glycerol-3-phosphate dehydrogenase